MSTLQSTGLFDLLFGTEPMRAVFSDTGRLQGMLDFEAALARAEAKTGVVPQTAVAAIEAACKAELYDLYALAQGAALGGNSAIPMVKALTTRVKAADADAARYVHWGATSQDAMDTGLVLQIRAGLDLVDADLAKLAAAAARLARDHRDTTLVGRTWLQQALPTTFGLKAAGWMQALDRHQGRLKETRARALALQFGGAAGTLAALGAQGLKVADALGAELGLPVPATPWHAQRDNVVEVATTLGLLAGSLGKIAKDISLLMQTEVGEALEPAAAGKGGSSTMPHKRNPVGAASVLATAIRVPALVSVMLTAMPQEHERGLGNWAAEWDTLPEIFVLTAGALAQLVPILENLEVKPERMRANLDVTGGLILAEAVTMALGEKIGRMPAHHLVEQACKRAVAQGAHLKSVLEKDDEVRVHLSAADLDRLLDPSNYTGMAAEMVDRALASRN